MKETYELQVIKVLAEIIRDAIRLMPLGTSVRAEWIKRALAALDSIK